MSTSYSLKTELLKRIMELSEPLEPLDTGEKPVLKKLDDIRAVVFDFYGTLFMSGTGDTMIDDPMGNEARAFEEAFKTIFPKLKNQPDSEEGAEIYKNAILNKKASIKKKEGIEYPEIEIKEIWKDVFREYEKREFKGLPTDPDDDLLQRLTIEFEMRNNPTWPMPDLEETLEDLKEKELLLGILSNSQFYTPMIYEAHTGFEPGQNHFDVNLCFWSYRERMCKPALRFHGALKQALMAHFMLMPDEVLYVGNDMLKDIYPAHHHGFKTALFAGDDRSLKWRKDDSRVKGVKPDLVIGRLHQLVECV